MRDIDEIKPRKWLVVLLILIALVISVVLINKIITDKENNKKDNKGMFDIFNINNIESSFKKDSFNSDFEFYTGSKSGFLLENMFEKVITNNKKNERKVSIKYNEINTNNPEEIKNLKKEIKDGDKFEVSINYDEKGYVSEIVLELTEKDMTEVRWFNTSYESYNGTEWGTTVKDLLEKVITNNKTNPDRILTIIYKDINTTDVEQIKNLKSRFDDWTDYEVSLNYNEEGYIYQIVIE